MNPSQRRKYGDLPIRSGVLPRPRRRGRYNFVQLRPCRWIECPHCGWQAVEAQNNAVNGWQAAIQLQGRMMTHIRDAHIDRGKQQEKQR